MNFGSNQIAGYFASGKIPKRWGNEHPNLTPYQTFQTADGHIIIACGNDGQFRSLCQLIDLPTLASDPRFLTMPQRNVNREALTAILGETFLSKPSSHWLGLLADSDVPSGSINNYEQVFQHPQVVHRKMRIDMPHPLGGTVGLVANPVRLSATPVEYRYPPPLRGQHTEEILASLLGKTSNTMNVLRSARVIEIGIESCQKASTH